MTDVLVYQMGKCASSAIVEALQAAGLEAAHTHALGSAPVLNCVRRLTTRPVPNFELEHGVGQLVHDIRLTSEILHRRASSDRIRVITLGRHPVNGYWSSLTQTFDARKHDLLAADTITAFEDAWARGDARVLSELHRIIVDASVAAIDRGMVLAAEALDQTTGDSLGARIVVETPDREERGVCNLGECISMTRNPDLALRARHQ